MATYTSDVAEYKGILKRYPDVGSLDDQVSLNQAADLVKSGRIIVAQMRGVFGFFSDAQQHTSVAKIRQIKGDKPDKALSTMISGENFIKLLDLDHIHPAYRAICKDAQEYEQVFGSICHTKAPILKNYSTINKIEIPADIYTTERLPDGKERKIIYNLSTIGHDPMTRLLTEIHKRGVDVVAVTSANPSKQPEYTSREEVLEYCTNYIDDIPFVLTDPLPIRRGIVGSFPQFDLITGYLIREGHIPTDLLEFLLTKRQGEGKADSIVNKKITKKSNYPSYNFKKEEILNFEINNPASLRKAILDFIHTTDEEVV